jgi:hypothetical protein
MVHRRHREKPVVRRKTAELGRRGERDQGARAVGEQHTLGLARGPRRVGDRPCAPLIDTRQRQRAGILLQETLVLRAELDDALDSGQHGLPHQRRGGRIDEHHARTRIGTDGGDLGRRETGIDGGDRDTGLGHTADDFEILDAVPRHDRHVVTRTESQLPDAACGHAVKATDQLTVTATTIAMQHGDLLGSARGRRTDPRPHGHRMERRRKGSRSD